MEGTLSNLEPPITDEEMGFIRQVIATPDDMAPRLAYADWLMERDIDSTPIKDQIRFGLNYLWFAGNRNRFEDRILARYDSVLLVYDNRLVARENYNPRMGFIEYLSCSLDWLKRSGEELFRYHPIREVHITNDSLIFWHLQQSPLYIDWLEPGRYFTLVFPSGREVIAIRGGEMVEFI